MGLGLGLGLWLGLGFRLGLGLGLGLGHSSENGLPLGRTSGRAEAMRGYEPGHHGAQCRPEVSVPLTAKDHGPEKRRSRDQASTRLPLLPGGCPGSSKTLTLSQGPKCKFHFPFASHVTKR